MTDADRPSTSPPFTRRGDWLFDLRMALKKIQPSVFQRLARRRHQPWDESESELHIAADAILQHLELCGWIISRKPPLQPHRAPAPDAGLGLRREEEASG